MTIAVILGIRIGITKMSPIIREYVKQGIEYYILHKGQHYINEMNKIFFEQLKLPYSKQTGKMITRIEEILMEDRADILKNQAQQKKYILKLQPT